VQLTQVAQCRGPTTQKEATA